MLFYSTYEQPKTEEKRFQAKMSECCICGSKPEWEYVGKIDDCDSKLNLHRVVTLKQFSP